jgi:tetratricopeptide (TPR) repeat protein
MRKTTIFGFSLQSESAFVIDEEVLPMDDIDPQLLAVQGYLELGMLEDARAELGAVQGAAREGVDFAVLQIEVLMLAKCWSHARDACQKFSQRWPDNSHGFLHEAYCLHELGDTGVAIEVLHSGPDFLLGEAVYHYNLACYHAVIGDLDMARGYLRRAIRMDRSFRASALEDPDLVRLRDELTG